MAEYTTETISCLPIVKAVWQSNNVQSTKNYTDPDPVIDFIHDQSQGLERMHMMDVYTEKMA